jgi:hypothetical protein
MGAIANPPLILPLGILRGVFFVARSLFVLTTWNPYGIHVFEEELSL